jgi:hypothetical protein
MLSVNGWKPLVSMLFNSFLFTDRIPVAGLLATRTPKTLPEDTFDYPIKIIKP